MLGEAVGRSAKEGTAAHRERADRGVAVGLGVERRGATGRVIPEALLALEHDHAASLSKEVPGRGSGDAAADNQKIGGHWRYLSLVGTSMPASRQYLSAPGWSLAPNALNSAGVTERQAGAFSLSAGRLVQNVFVIR